MSAKIKVHSFIESVWVEQLRMWGDGNLHAMNLWKSRTSMTQFTLAHGHVGIINYESVSKLPQWYLSQIGHLILDESSRIKAHDTAITKFLAGYPNGKTIGWGRSVPYRLLLSGTPAPNTPMEYWSQMSLLDASLLGPSFWAFRATHFRNHNTYAWLPIKGAHEFIIGQVKKRSFYIAKEDCLDLPDQIFESKVFAMDRDQEKVYNDMKKTNLAELHGRVVLGANEVAKIMKLRQVTSGFINDNQGQPVTISESKLKLLKETLEEIGPDKQVIIWCQFHYEIGRISKILKDNNMGTHAMLYGEVKQSDKEAAISAFQNGEVKYLVAHPKSGGVGLTFVNCSYNIYYSLDYSFESLKQSQDRTHRIGQTNKVTYIFLLADKSIDQVIYKALVKKEDMSEAMLRMI